LRTPLNAIMGMGHLLRSTALDARQQGYLGKMLVSGQDLLALIDDILNYVRIETGTLELERSEFALADLLVSVLDRIRDKAAAKGLSLRAESAPELPSRLKGDAGRIGQVLHKLAENAVKFTRAGEMSLAARLLAREGDELLLRFEVRDTGIGLSAADQSRLFRAFEQGDNSSTRQHGGTGLGLAIAQRLVDLLGGEIGVESEPGRGSLFWFTVRLGVAQGVAGTLALPPPAMPVDPPRAAVPQAVHDEGQWLRVCAELIGLLEQDDTESLQVLEGNGALLRAALGPDFERLADALHRFDFALALALLQERH
jgi:signal transduction histidine kinase